MSDLADSNVHGPVETLRTETAEWDPATQAWQPPKFHTVLRFLPDGRLKEGEYYNPEGSSARSTHIYDESGHLLETRFQTGDGPVSRSSFSYDGEGRLVRTVNIDEKGTHSESEICRYDEHGRKTKTQFPKKAEGDVSSSYDVQGTGAVMFRSEGASVTTYYDDRDQPAEILIHDSTHRLLQRTTLTYDAAGKIVRQEVHSGVNPTFPGLEEKMKDTSPEDRGRLMAALRNAFSPDNKTLIATFAYDQRGRQVEKTRRMGALSEEQTTSRFDDHDNPIEEITAGTSREMQMDEQGNLHPSRESSVEQHTRFTYAYDAQGNWTERVVWSIVEPAKDFQRSNIERRQITYYPPRPDR